MQRCARLLRVKRPSLSKMTVVAVCSVLCASSVLAGVDGSKMDLSVFWLVCAAARPGRRTDAWSSVKDGGVSEAWTNLPESETCAGDDGPRVPVGHLLH